MEASGLPIIRVFKRNKNLILLAVPVFLELMLSVAMGYVNQFLLSGIPLASNAVSQSNQITNIFVVSFSVLSNSSLILLSQLLGKENEEEAVGRIYSLSLIINLVLGVIVAGICIGIAFFVFPLMGVDEAVIPYAIRYQIVSAPSLIFQALTNVFSSFLRANKKMAFPTAVAFLTNIVNAGIAALFIWGIPGNEMDRLVGVALATDISRFLGLAASVLFFVFGAKGRLSFRLLHPFPGKTLSKLLKIGLPTAGETLSYNFSQLVLSIIVNFSVSVLEQNLRTYIMTFTSLIYLFASGTGIAMQVVEGNLLGQGNKDDADLLVRDVGTMARTVSFLMAIVFTGLAYPVFYALMGPAVADPEVNDIGASIQTVALMAVYCMLIDIVLDQGRATNLVYVKALETGGDISFPVLCSIFTSWLFTVGASALLCIVCGLGIYGAFIGAMLDECVRAILFYVRWRRGGWRKRSLTQGLE